MKTEQVILKNLITNEGFSKKSLPFLKDLYFSEQHELVLFRVINTYTIKYNSLPTNQILKTEIPQVKGFSDETIKKSYELVDYLDSLEAAKDEHWLLDITEQFCQNMAIQNAVSESIDILQGKGKSKDKGIIPELLKDALSISFNMKLGHDYFEDFEERFRLRHDISTKLPFDLEMLNKTTNGGLGVPSITVLLGGVNVGKTLSMCSLAASHIAMGYDVLYVTLEMAENFIADRIDANALDIGLENLYKMTHPDFKNSVHSLRKKTMGRLKIVEYANGTASALHFKSLLRELYIKKNFKPNVIYIDYLNLCLSCRLVKGKVSGHDYLLSITEELRALSQEEKIPIITATQLSREGFKDADPDMDSIAQSWGITQPADVIWCLISNPELEKLGQYIIKQLKNRFGDKRKNKAFIVGVDYDKQRLYDVDLSAYENVGMKDVTPPEDSEKTPKQLLLGTKHKNKNRFEGITV